MEDNKYYTPDRSDFIDGLEYKDIRTPDLGYTYNLRPGKELEFNCLRVKYLDKEDIESLGFRVGYEFDNENMFVSNDRETQLYYNSLEEDLTKGVGLEIYTNYNDKICIYIKNKSELKKLMQQLNICKKD